MTVEEQIDLGRNEKFKAIMTKAMNKVCKDLLDLYQDNTDRTKTIHTKLYTYASNFTKKGIASESERSSCIGRLLDDVTYTDPDANPDATMTALYNKIKSDYQASFIQTPANTSISWIEIIAGYEFGDEDEIV